MQFLNLECMGLKWESILPDNAQEAFKRKIRNNEKSDCCGNNHNAVVYSVDCMG